MLSRRSLTTRGIAGLLTLGAARAIPLSAQTPVSGMEYQGVLGFRNLPELPTAPAGECAIVLQASKWDDFVAVVYHNATSETVCVNQVTASATNSYGSISAPFSPENTIHAPHILAPGEYGIACAAFERRLDEDDDVMVEITVVPESEADPALVSLPVMNIEISTDGDMAIIESTVQNRSGSTLAEGAGMALIFFTLEGEILDWHANNSMSEFESEGENHSTANIGSLEISDSFMVVFGGRAIN